MARLMSAVYRLLVAVWTNVRDVAAAINVPLAGLDPCILFS